MRISEIATKAGVSTRTIRYYEQKKLLQSSRLENGYRDYNDTSIKQIHAIRFYLSLGFTTDEIANFLDYVSENKAVYCQKILKQKINEIDDQILILNQMKSNLLKRVSDYSKT